MKDMRKFASKAEERRFVALVGKLGPKSINPPAPRQPVVRGIEARRPAWTWQELKDKGQTTYDLTIKAINWADGKYAFDDQGVWVVL